MPGPAVIDERPQRGWIEAGDGLAISLRVRGQEAGGQPWNVFAPIAQRRQMNLDRVETEEQILPEPPGRDFGVEIGVGRRDQPDVRLSRARRSETLELTGLEHAQQLLLLAERHVGDLVEEQRAAIGHLESPDAILLGVGEGALHVAEELALEHPFGHAAGVDSDHGPRRAHRHAVKRLRDEALARAVFAGDEHVGVGRPHAIDHLQHRAHRGRLGDQRRARLRWPHGSAPRGVRPGAARVRAPSACAGS